MIQPVSDCVKKNRGTAAEQCANRLVRLEGFRQALRSSAFWCDHYALHGCRCLSECYRSTLWHLTSHAEDYV